MQFSAILSETSWLLDSQIRLRFEDGLIAEAKKHCTSASVGEYLCVHCSSHVRPCFLGILSIFWQIRQKDGEASCMATRSSA